MIPPNYPYYCLNTVIFFAVCRVCVASIDRPSIARRRAQDHLRQKRPLCSVELLGIVASREQVAVAVIGHRD
jgi:hypothetical protein